MAGSYSHVSPVPHGDSGEKYSGSWSMIENMGDAYECVEELLWLVLTLARIVAVANGDQDPSIETLDKIIRAELDEGFYPISNGDRPKDKVFLAVEKVMSE